MIAYLLFIRIKGYILGLKSPSNIGLTLLLILVAWVYGWSLAVIINKAYQGDIGSLTPEIAIYYSMGAIAGFVMIRMIFPRYKPQRQYLPKYYPLSGIQHYMISILSDFLKPLFFSLTLFISICCLYLKDSQFTFLYLGVSAMISAQLFRRIIQYGIDFRKKSIAYGLISIALMLLVTVATFHSYFYPYLKVLGLTIPLFLFATGYLLELTVIESRRNQLSGVKGINNFYLKLFINNPKARLILLVGILFKLFLLSGDYMMFKGKGKHMFDGQFVYWLFASPLILFTYVFNNVWGFWRSVWLNCELRVGSYKMMIQFVAKLLVIPLFIDVIITIPLLLMTWDNVQFILLFYVFAMIFLVSFSFLWSILFPISIRTTFQMRGSSSFVSTSASMIAVVLLAMLKLNYWFYILIPFYLFLSIMAYKFSLDLYREKKYSLVDKLKYD